MQRLATLPPRTVLEAWNDNTIDGLIPLGITSFPALKQYIETIFEQETVLKDVRQVEASIKLLIAVIDHIYDTNITTGKKAAVANYLLALDTLDLDKKSKQKFSVIFRAIYHVAPSIPEQATLLRLAMHACWTLKCIDYDEVIQILISEYPDLNLVIEFLHLSWNKILDNKKINAVNFSTLLNDLQQKLTNNDNPPKNLQILVKFLDLLFPEISTSVSFDIETYTSIIYTEPESLFSALPQHERELTAVAILRAKDQTLHAIPADLLILRLNPLALNRHQNATDTYRSDIGRRATDEYRDYYSGSLPFDRVEKWILVQNVAKTKLPNRLSQTQHLMLFRGFNKLAESKDSYPTRPRIANIFNSVLSQEKQVKHIVAAAYARFAMVGYIEQPDGTKVRQKDMRVNPPLSLVAQHELYIMLDKQLLIHDAPLSNTDFVEELKTNLVALLSSAVEETQDESIARLMSANVISKPIMHVNMAAITPAALAAVIKKSMNACAAKDNIRVAP